MKGRVSKRLREKLKAAASPPTPDSAPPEVHAHKCVEPAHDGYRCASRGYCKCECGAGRGVNEDDWWEPLQSGAGLDSAPKEICACGHTKDSHVPFSAAGANGFYGCLACQPDTRCTSYRALQSGAGSVGEEPSCPNPSCDKGFIRGSRVGCAVCNGGADIPMGRDRVGQPPCYFCKETYRHKEDCLSRQYPRRLPDSDDPTSRSPLVSVEPTDTQRLDWLEANPGVVHPANAVSSGWNMEGFHDEEEGWGNEELGLWYPTLRQAIDKAMEASNGK